MFYRRIIPYLVLLAAMTGCNAPADPNALQHPINQHIVNAQCVTLETISVNGEKIPEISRAKAIETFRQYVGGDVRVVEGKPVTIPLNKDGKITFAQIDDILKNRQYRGASDIAILYIPDVEKNDKWAAYYRYDSNGKEYRQFILYQSSFVTQRSKKYPLPLETCHQHVLAHELCHSFWVPCDRKRSWSERHCTHSDCLIYATVDIRAFGTYLLRGKSPLDLCPDCQAEIRQARQDAKGKLIPPEEPYDFGTYCNDLVRLNPDNPAAYTWRFRYHFNCKQYDPAIADLTRIIELDPNTLQNYMNRAATFQLKGDIPSAEKDIHEIAKRLGTNTQLLNQFAWLLATAPDTSFRSGKIAVEIASKVCTLDNWKSAEYIDTLAASCAEQGNFDKAVEYQTQAIQKDYKKKYEGDFKKRLELYRRKKPYRSSWQQ